MITDKRIKSTIRRRDAKRNQAKSASRNPPSLGEERRKSCGQTAGQSSKALTNKGVQHQLNPELEFISDQLYDIG